VTRESKRFYRQVSVERASGLEGVGWVITVGGRRIQTPGQYVCGLLLLVACVFGVIWRLQTKYVTLCMC
jgi:hypothetical protein